MDTYGLVVACELIMAVKQQRTDAQRTAALRRTEHGMACGNDARTATILDGSITADAA
jgi:hypothetical protein